MPPQKVIRDYEGKLTAGTIKAVQTWFTNLWISRHGTNNILDANPWHRVMWTDIITRFPGLDMHDRLQLQPHIDRTLKKLRKAYPTAAW